MDTNSENPNLSNNNSSADGGGKEDFEARMKDLHKVENPVEAQKRHERYNAFNEFHKIVEKKFKSFRDNDDRALLYQAFNMLCICPGSRMGMDKRDVVEVFWGHRIYDNAFKESSLRHFKFKTETGVTLFFLQKDDGYVTIYLSPAFTDSYKEIDETIILSRSIDPHELLKEKNLFELWKQFMAYTEFTHLDGRPSICQYARIYWLRFIKFTLRADKLYNPRYMTVLYEIVKWVVTVGLSGAILTGIQMCKDSRNTDSATLKEINTSIRNSLDGKLDTTKNNTAEIKAKLADSIIIKNPCGCKKPVTTKTKRKQQPDGCIKYLRVNTCRDTVVAKR